MLNRNKSKILIDISQSLIIFYVLPTMIATCYELETDLWGNDLNAHPSSMNFAQTSGRRNSVRDCQTLCQSTARCLFFTYWPDNNHCYLKTSDSGRQKSYPKGAISGPKQCDGE